MNVGRFFSIKAMPDAHITNDAWECLFYHIITEKMNAINVFKYFVSWVPPLRSVLQRLIKKLE